MAKHSPQHGIPRGEKSTKGAANGSPGTPGYTGRHRPTTEMDTANPSTMSRIRPKKD